MSDFFFEILFFHIFTDLSLRAFITTEILEKAIAALASIGFSKIPKNGYKAPIATGINTTL